VLAQGVKICAQAQQLGIVVLWLHMWGWVVHASDANADPGEPGTHVCKFCSGGTSGRAHKCVCWAPSASSGLIAGGIVDAGGEDFVRRAWPMWV
jgi:hypothetical protein